MSLTLNVQTTNNILYLGHLYKSKRFGNDDFYQYRKILRPINKDIFFYLLKYKVGIKMKDVKWSQYLLNRYRESEEKGGNSRIVLDF